MSGTAPPTPSLHPLLEPSASVVVALAAGRPVVALESTIVAHGCPGRRTYTRRVRSKQ